jgi:multidrug efflux system outer membrane protein
MPTGSLIYGGKLRRANEAARADILSQEYSKRAVLLSLVTAVVQGYVNLLSLDLQLVISKQTADSRKGTLDIFNDRYKGGVVSGKEPGTYRQKDIPR